MNNSTNYWKNTFQNALCGCDRTDDLIKEDPSTVTSKKNSLFKVTNINQEHNKGNLRLNLYPISLSSKNADSLFCFSWKTQSDIRNQLFSGLTRFELVVFCVTSRRFKPANL